MGARGAVAAVSALLIAGSVAVAVTVGPDRAARIVRGAPEVVAPEDARPVPELAGVTEWVNSAPLSMASLRGRVVLVDFWTYSCINCRRTFPFLRALHETYGPRGLTVLGVHSPEFDFEKDPANVERAVRSLGVTWPVAMDPDKATWDAFDNRYWPADYVVDANGLIRAQHVGEGDEEEVEDAIRSLLADPGPRRAARSDRAHGRLTPELYLGYSRGGQVADGATVTRADAPGTPDVPALTGRFTGALEWVAAAAPGATVTLDYTARDVYAVLAPPPGAPPGAAGSAPGSAWRVEVLLDGAPVPPARRGAAVVEAGGRTYVDVAADDLYHLLTGPSSGRDRVALRAERAGLRWFTFTFGG
ncbi:MAG TPA: redoxin domain-containing protein [Mycobacteriales bacterium]